MKRLILATFAWITPTLLLAQGPAIDNTWHGTGYNYIVSSNSGPGGNPFTGFHINDVVLQANRWTNAGFTGTGAVVANVEGAGPGLVPIGIKICRLEE